MQIRCPHCQNPIEVVSDDDSFEFDCPSCGSSFNLASDVKTATQPSGMPNTIGHFHLSERLGFGQFGAVWKARDTELDRTIAIKIPRKEKLDAAESEKFLREARASAQLKHPHIVAVHEVGRQEDTLYIASDYIQGANLARSEDAPMSIMSWYEAAWYCNWLSEQEGIPKDQWCYEPITREVRSVSTKAKASFLKLTGYRLPTESEWEYACRAGTISSRYYGRSEALLPLYAWFELNAKQQVWPAARLKPNDFGLFDMQGNVGEWCYDLAKRYTPAPGPASGMVIVDAPESDTASKTGRRIIRGRGFADRAQRVRSANRDFNEPGNRDAFNGFHVARTYDVSP